MIDQDPFDRRTEQPKKSLVVLVTFKDFKDQNSKSNNKYYY